MKWVFSLMIVLSVILSLMTGRTEEVSQAALSECGNAVTLAITLCGIICLWSGLMRVAQSAGMTELLAKLFRPVLSRLFSGIDARGKAMQYIVLNISANMLGLGNASTPFGMAAMKELEKEEKTHTYASDNMILFVVLNTASLQLIPTTVAALRLKNGSSAPMEILPAVWIVSVLCVTAAVVAAKILRRIWRKNRL